ncbi:hypothetical protein QNI19_27330 [Cytophagaceae bacterium DM2B3-1]|uniref:ABC transporter permease n=1 Tax=Xanthocytophaga flava TaxID=3048013 RepID=A0ABT7CSM6_9BACT|nr:hypothetical protein [Xanthocytophaga flavus]MDJ1471475.1 hypothetical protein [Xanthocytophaga flavus]MDJ1496676.1 hypothetical protein [Xanthocytophaga flavus]
MPVSTLTHTTSFFFKFRTCLLAVTGIVNVVLMILITYLSSWLQTIPGFTNWILVGIPLIILITSGSYSVWWHRQEMHQQKDLGLHRAWLQGIIRYWLAFCISTYGFAKILKTQFTTPEYQLDTPLGEISGFGLTWYYFGYSYTLAVIIALFQIGGSILLLYRRTTLLGTFLLLPVMVNIVLIDMFFGIDIGAFINAVLFTIGLLYLLLNDFQKLKAVFWDLTEKVPAISLGYTKHVLRIIPIAAAFAMIYYFISTDQTDHELTGTWQVRKFVRNGQVASANAWQQDSTIVSRIYFFMETCDFSPSPEVYNPVHGLHGLYTFDPKTNHLLIRYPNIFTGQDSIAATLSQRTSQSMVLDYTFNNDTLHLELSRLERKKKKGLFF